MYCAGHLIQAAVAHARTAGRAAAAGRRAPVRRPAGRPLRRPGGRASTATRSSRPRWSSCTGRRPRAVPQPGQPVRRAARPGADRRLRLRQPLPAGPYAGPGVDRPIVGHAVRALYLEAGVVDVAVETGDAELLATSVTRWEDMVSTKTSLTGGVGSRHSGESFGDRSSCRPTVPTTRPARRSPASSGAGGCCWPPASAKYADLIERAALQRLRRRRSPPAGSGSSTSTRCSAARITSRRRSRAPPGVVLLRLLPAEHHAPAGVRWATTWRPPADDVLYLHQFTGASIGANLAAAPSAST